jgi:predicted outer membrane repeat protein
MRNLILTALVSFFYINSNAATIVVNNLNDSGTGSLRKAVSDAVDNDVIRFNPNLVSGGNATIQLASEIMVSSKEITIKGLYNNSDTLFISGENSSRIFNVDIGSNWFTLDSVSLINGNAQNGGAIRFFDSGILVIENCFFNNNVATISGGAIYCETTSTSSTPTFTFSLYRIYTSTFSNNSAQIGSGGAISYNAPTSPYWGNFPVIDCSGFNNSAGGSGGFLYSTMNLKCEILLNRGDFYNNQCVGNGGFLYYQCLNDEALVRVSSCNVENNSAENGGGIYAKALNNRATIILTASTFSNNTAVTDGGAAKSESNIGLAQIQSSRCTIDNNTAGSNGGGLCSSAAWSIVQIGYSTLSNNTAAKGGAVYSFSSNPTTDGLAILSQSTCYNNIATDNIGNGIYCEAIPAQDCSVNLRSSIVFNGANNIYASNNEVNSSGYNILNNSMTGVLSTDQTNVDSTDLNLLPLANYGGSTQTHLPGPFSVAINMGVPNDPSDAQNDTLTGIRDVGAAENRNVYWIDTLSGCNSFTWVDGNTYVEDTLGALHTFTGALNTGFDSIVKLNLELSYSTSSSISQFTCTDYTSPSGNYTWTTTGIYNDTIPNAVGCDSIITVDLNVSTETQASFTQNICESMISPSGSYTWTTSGTYMDTIPNNQGCDSIMTFNLTVNFPNSGTDVITACDAYTWIDGNTYTSSNNSVTYTSTNQVGCDSIVSLDLTINSVDATVNINVPHLAADVAGASYQWLDCGDSFSPINGETSQLFTAVNNGSYALEIAKNGCTDTSTCILIDNIGLSQEQLTSIKLYPNPTKGWITIEKQGEATVPFEIRDLTGRVIHKGSLSIPETTIDLSNFSNQIYLLDLGERTIRFIKQ